MEWGTAGAYERLKGTAYMEVDPRDPLNAVIVNLDRAPRNGRGMVEFSSPFLILKPVDMSRGNRKIWYGINNRGNCIEVGNCVLSRRLPATCNPLTVADVGAEQCPFAAGLCHRRRWLARGWQSPNPNQLFPNFPVAKQPGGSPIVDLQRIELSFQPAPRHLHSAPGAR